MYEIHLQYNFYVVFIIVILLFDFCNMFLESSRNHQFCLDMFVCVVLFIRLFQFVTEHLPYHDLRLKHCKLGALMNPNLILML